MWIRCALRAVCFTLAIAGGSSCAFAAPVEKPADAATRHYLQGMLLLQQEKLSEAIDELRALQQRVAVGQGFHRQHQCQHRRQKAQPIRTRVHLDVIDGLAVRRTAGHADGD